MQIKDLIDHINEVSYEGNLKVANIVKSVNCKEWENEKKDSKYKDCPMAIRYYLQLKNEDNNNLGNHCHKGHIDFRSSSTSISDAYLPIPKNANLFITCKKSYISDDPFNPTIVTVPYITPDPKISLCSPATLWIVLRTLSNELSKEYISLTDINKNLPPQAIGNSVGIKEYIELFKNYSYTAHYYLGYKKKMFYDECEKKISECGDCILNHFYSVFRAGENDVKEPLMNSEILYSYIESEIPVYLVFESEELESELKYKGETTDKYHSVVAIGHTLDNKYDYSHFVIHDVSHAPFVKISKKFVDENLMEALVILPKEVNIRYEHLVQESLSSNLGKLLILYNKYDKINFPIKMRPFLMRSQRIKFWFTNRELYPQNEIYNMFSEADFPKYVWVFEIKTAEVKEDNQCIGHIIFDATVAPNNTKGVVLINLPKYKVWYQESKIHNEISDISTFETIPIFRSPKKSIS